MIPDARELRKEADISSRAVKGARNAMDSYKADPNEQNLRNLLLEVERLVEANHKLAVAARGLDIGIDVSAAMDEVEHGRTLEG